MTNRCPNCQTLIANGVICPKCGLNIMDLKEEPQLEAAGKTENVSPSAINSSQNNTPSYNNPQPDNIPPYSNQQNPIPQQTQAPAQTYYTKRRVFPNLRVILIIAAIVCFIGGIINYSQAIDVKDNYTNSEYSIINHNAYVGGDAYNYIINSNYFTGYTVASVGLFVCGALSLVSLIFISVKEKEFEKIEFQNAKLTYIEYLLNGKQDSPSSQIKR